MSKPDDKGRHPWSLIGRLRLESDVLSEAACRSLASFTQTMQDVISQAVEYAWQQGQLKADTPRQDLIFLLTNLVDSSSVFSQNAGSFCTPGTILHRFLPSGVIRLHS